MPTSRSRNILSIRRTLLAVSAAAVICATAALSNAAAPALLLDTEGFEAPTFSTGDLVGQNGWVSAGSGSVSATIEDANPIDGAQSLRVDRGANSTGFFASYLGGVPDGGSNIIQIEWDMTYELLEQTDGSFGPFFGVQAFDDLTSPGNVLDIATLGVDATTSDILIADGASGHFKESGFVVTHDEPHHYDLVLNFNNSTYTAFVDGVKIGQETFVNNSDQAPVATATTLTDADIVGRAAGGDTMSMGLVSHANFDNFTITQGIAADFDDDDDVDGDDLTIWEGTFGATDAGDADGDGDSDGNDFITWQRQFGLTSPPAAAAAGVPEPSTAALAMLALVGLGAGCCRFRSR